MVPARSGSAARIMVMTPAIRAAWVAQGGSEEEFEKEWGGMRREHIRKQMAEQRSAVTRHYTSSF
jgi:hypothetical protein